jgi:hypothetical protein
VLWPLAILVVVPLLVHLLARTRPPVFEFSSVEFLRRALRFTQRVRKPKDWLLLLLRTAAVTAVVLLFLRPVLFSHGGGLLVRRNVVVILDTSASMGWSEGSQTRFAVACAEASEILAGLSARDRANVILAGREARALLPVMGGNIGYLQGELRRARLTAEALDPDAALRLAVRLLLGEEGRKEICVVSDFQASNWRGVKPRLPPDIGLTSVGMARGEALNAALLRVVVEPTHPLPGEEATVLCEVANFGSLPQRKTVVLSGESTRASREVVVPAWGRATVAFPLRVTATAPYPLGAALTEDGFPGDDRRWVVVAPTEALQIGWAAFDQGGETAAAWVRACQALGWARPTQVNLAEQTEIRSDVLLLSGWDGSQPERVRRFLAAGVPVVWYPAADMPLARIAAVLTNAPASEAGARTVWEERPEGVRLQVAAAEHAALRIFGGGEFGDPARGRVRGRLVLPRTALPPGEALLAYADGLPAIWWCQGARPLVLWALPLDKGISSVAAQGEFVPFLGELMLEARRRGPGTLRAVREHQPGELLEGRAGSGGRVGDWHLKGPDGTELPVRILSAVEGNCVSERVTRTGVYAWSLGERVVSQEAVNFPAVESDLRPLSAAEIQQMGAQAAASGREVREWQAGVALWPALLWTALAILLCEGVVVALDARGRARNSSSVKQSTAT